MKNITDGLLHGISQMSDMCVFDYKFVKLNLIGCSKKLRLKKKFGS